MHKEYQQNFIVFKEVASEQSNKLSQDFLVLQNDLKLAKIEFSQYSLNEDQNDNNRPLPFKAQPGDKIVFGWDDL